MLWFLLFVAGLFGTVLGLLSLLGLGVITGVTEWWGGILCVVTGVYTAVSASKKFMR